MPGELLTVKEAAALLGVHPNTVRGWGRRGRLPELRVGPRHDRRYQRSCVLALLTDASSMEPSSSPSEADVSSQLAHESNGRFYRFPFMGLGGSGVRDTSERVEEILRDEWGRAGNR